MTTPPRPSDERTAHTVRMDLDRALEIPWLIKRVAFLLEECERLRAALEVANEANASQASATQRLSDQVAELTEENERLANALWHFRPRVTGVPERKTQPWSEYPLGTIASDHIGCRWVKIASGWKAIPCGDVFPTPGADALWVTLP